VSNRKRLRTTTPAADPWTIPTQGVWHGELGNWRCKHDHASQATALACAETEAQLRTGYAEVLDAALNLVWMEGRDMDEVEHPERVNFLPLKM
jgi:hypothetical protein